MRRSRRGIVGIEAAIVMIAFVIVAAALAFVALNMGMSATQKTKEAIGASMGEAGSALMVDGEVMANATDTNQVSAIFIPVRPSSGKYPVDLSLGKTIISIRVGNDYYANIYTVAYDNDNTTAVNNNLPASTSVLSIFQNGNNGSAITCTTSPVATVAFIGGDGDYILEYGEKAVVAVCLDSTHYLGPYQSFQVEVKPPEGSPLLVERTIPPSLPQGGGLFSLG